MGIGVDSGLSDFPNIPMFDDGDWIEDRMIARCERLTQWLGGGKDSAPDFTLTIPRGTWLHGE